MPHGMAVVMTAPAAFDLLRAAAPERHRRAAELLGGEELPTVLRSLMRDVGLPSGLAELGFDRSDVDDLVGGALQQQRLLATAPIEVGADELAGVFRASMEHW